MEMNAQNTGSWNGKGFSTRWTPGFDQKRRKKKMATPVSSSIILGTFLLLIIIILSAREKNYGFWGIRWLQKDWRNIQKLKQRKRKLMSFMTIVKSLLCQKANCGTWLYPFNQPNILKGKPLNGWVASL